MNQQFNKLTDRLLDLPREIQDIQLEILERTEAGKVNQDRITTIEAKIKAEIGSAVDANGKKLYSNAEARDAAFVEESAKNDELASLKLDYDCLQKEIQEKRIEVEMLNNEQRNARTLLTFFASNSEFADQN